MQDGIPDFCKISAAERKEAWTNVPVTKVSSTVQPKEMSTEATAFAKVLAEQKQQKTKAHFDRLKRRKTNQPNPKTHSWDSADNCWVADKIYRAEENVRPDFNNLNNPELVKVFNEMAVEAAKLDIPVTATKRFSTRDAGLRRCEELLKTITEKKGETYEQPKEDKSEPKERKTAEPKKDKPATAAAKKEKPERDEIAEACGVRAGSLHARILECLYRKLGEQVTEQAIIKHLYPDKPVGHKTNRIKDLMKVMKTKYYKVKKQEDEKGNVSYGLYKNNE